MKAIKSGSIDCSSQATPAPRLTTTTSKAGVTAADVVVDQDEDPADSRTLSPSIRESGVQPPINSHVSPSLPSLLSPLPDISAGTSPAASEHTTTPNRRLDFPDGVEAGVRPLHAWGDDEDSKDQSSTSTDPDIVSGTQEDMVSSTMTSTTTGVEIPPTSRSKKRRRKKGRKRGRQTQDKEWIRSES